MRYASSTHLNPDLVVEYAQECMEIRHVCSEQINAEHNELLARVSDKPAALRRYGCAARQVSQMIGHVPEVKLGRVE